MHNSFLVFDFGADEAAAQQARNKLESWKQAFRLDKKLLYKFEREPGPEAPSAPAKARAEESEPEKPTKAKSTKGKAKPAKAASKAKAEEPPTPPADGAAAPSRDIKLLVRLYFSGHEKLTYQRWVDRIPTEEPFKDAKLQAVKSSDSHFAEVDQKFDSLE